MTIISDFISRVQAVYKTGAATEHSYRSALETLFNALAENTTALNEPKRVACGAPDFIIQRGEIIVGHAEAKDIGVGLRGMKDANKGQQDRYRAALPNLIYTNCLDWDFYRNGALIASITIADLLMGIQPRLDQYDALENLLRDFIAQRPQTITSPRVLAEMMAGKGVLIKDILGNALRADKDLNTELTGQFKAFKEHLIHDITPEDFGDIYAETIAYGMFAARLHDTSLDTFSRQEALELLPKSNPFLRSLFGYIAGPELDDRIRWVIDDLAAVFQAANVKKLMEGFGKLTGQNDPFLHFYETFLAAYNPAKRKARGVWYTPEPVVNFIVRAVDEVLQTEFGLPDGLADTSKVTVDWDTGETKNGKAVTIKKEVHRVQILDPATGTGTFLAEVIKQIAPKVKDVAEGMWSPYIERDLIPRLHGFELLMASYAMCHMKLDMILTEMGYKPTGTPPRLSVYLTNSLEEGERDVRDLFMAQWLTREAKEANTIKRQTPIMCVIGNPPYSASTSNRGHWIQRLVETYKAGLIEKKINLDDDYIKFIRFSQHLIERNGEGVMALITNNSYLDGVTHRRMRQTLMQAFETIYIFDLHGSSKKTESDLSNPDGEKDKNVFDIQQGVSIIVAIKKRIKTSSECSVFQAGLWGGREAKYRQLLTESIYRGRFLQLSPKTPYFFFSPKNFGDQNVYDGFLSISELFGERGSGVKTERDKVSIHFERDRIVEAVKLFQKGDEGEIRRKYELQKDSRDWTVSGAIADIRAAENEDLYTKITYRPFDFRFTFYTGTTRGFIGTPGRKIGSQFKHENLGLILSRTVYGTTPWQDAQVTDSIVEFGIMATRVGNTAPIFPLYLYPSEQDLDQTRRVNFDPKLYKRLQSLAKHPTHGTPDEVAVFDFIYGMLHCPAYRTTYAEFLKIDFPRIPWPATPDEFWDISAKGQTLRKLHLMDPATIGPAPYPFKGQGDGTVEKPRYEDGKVWINQTQYFDAAPAVSWGFYIGGYQPAQKWLKDRKGRALSFEDVKHYQRILKILSETDRIMATITMTLEVAEADAAQ